MKRTYLLLFLIPFFSLLSQAQNKEIDAIANAEMKSASNRLNIVTNPGTYNYDITYHKLEFTVDPAVYFISGKVTTTY